MVGSGQSLTLAHLAPSSTVLYRRISLVYHHQDHLRKLCGMQAISHLTPSPTVVERKDTHASKLEALAGPLEIQ